MGYDSRMRVLVTGGTGFVGNAIVGRLVRQGHEVRVLSRRGGSTIPGASGVAGTILSSVDVAEALSGCHGVIHLVGIIREMENQTFERIHTEATANLIHCLKSEGISRLVHMSALGARVEAPARYHRSKAAAENLVKTSALEWTIFRPSLIYGRGDGFVRLFDGISRWSPIVPVMGPGDNLLQPIDVETVAEAFVQALENPKSIGQVLDLCGPGRPTFLEVVRCILEIRGRTRWVLRVPWGLARLQATAFEWIFPKILGMPPPLNRDQLLMLQEDNIGDPEPALQILGVKGPEWKNGLREMLAQSR